MNTRSLHITNKPHSQRGFTLIEMLVVILIIATLSSLAMGGFQIARENARKTVAKKVCTDLVNAVQLFENDYGVLPTLAGAPAGDTTFITDNNLMDILLAKDTAANAQNSRQKRYLDLDIASTTDLATATNGLYETAATAHLLDPWHNRLDGGYYAVIVDSNYDNQITNPFADAAPKDVIRGKKVIAYSNGKNGLSDFTKVAKAEVNQDNVYSWTK